MGPRSHRPLGPSRVQRPRGRVGTALRHKGANTPPSSYLTLIYSEKMRHSFAWNGGP
jgi:hypothetical protein